jgi:uncharacterized membrane protein
MDTHRQYDRKWVIPIACISGFLGAFAGEIGHWGVAVLFFMIMLSGLLTYCRIVCMTEKEYQGERRD